MSQFPVFKNVFREPPCVLNFKIRSLETVYFQFQGSVFNLLITEITYFMHAGFMLLKVQGQVMAGSLPPFLIAAANTVIYMK